MHFKKSTVTQIVDRGKAKPNSIFQSQLVKAYKSEENLNKGSKVQFTERFSVSYAFPEIFFCNWDTKTQKYLRHICLFLEPYKRYLTIAKTDDCPK